MRAEVLVGIEIERLKLEIARLRRERFGPSSERSARIEQLELRLEDLEEAAGEAAASQTDEPIAVAAFERQMPARRPLPEHLPRHRIVHPGPQPVRAAAGRRCGSSARTSPRRSNGSRRAGASSSTSESASRASPARRSPRSPRLSTRSARTLHVGGMSRAGLAHTSQKGKDMFGHDLKHRGRIEVFELGPTQVGICDATTLAKAVLALREDASLHLESKSEQVSI